MISMLLDYRARNSVYNNTINLFNMHTLEQSNYTT